MTYNLTFMDTSTDILTTIQGINSNVNEAYGALFLLALGVVLFISMKNYDTPAVLLSVSFILSVVALPMFIINLIGVEIFTIPLVMLVISLFYMVASK